MLARLAWPPTAFVELIEELLRWRMRLHRLVRLHGGVLLPWLGWRCRLPKAEEVNDLFQELGFRRLGERFAVTTHAPVEKQSLVFMKFLQRTRII